MPILSLFKTKPKKSRRAYLIAQIDAIMSKRVRERDGHCCRHCGRVRGVYGRYDKKGHVFHHHIFTKARLSTRWTLENGVTLCYYCHQWAHAAGEEFREWVLGWYGEAQYEALYIKSQFRASFKECDLEMLLKLMRSEKI